MSSQENLESPFSGDARSAPHRRGSRSGECEERGMSLVIDAPERPRRSAPFVPAEIDGDKFSVPPLPGAYVDRPRLQHALSMTASVPLTLVVGPIGSGKTTLLASFARSRS